MNRKGFTLLDLLIVVPIIVLILMVSLPLLCRPHVEARLYNQMYGTNYSGWDFMLAGDTIKDYLNRGKQSTVNVNLDSHTR